MIYLVFYDITNTKSRTKVANRLVDMGYERIQYSVFTGLNDPVTNSNLWEFLKLNIDSECDKLYVLKVSKKAFKTMSKLGQSGLDIDYFSGDRQSLFF